MIAASVVLALAALRGDEHAQQETLLLRFRAEAVDGVDELVIRGREATIRHLEWDPMRGAVVEVETPTDAIGDRFIAVRARSGRAAIRIVERPSAANDQTLRVRIDDGPNGGDAPLAFELWAVPSKLAAHPYDVVVITIDSLRPDHLGSYGYARATSPNLDAFAKDGVRFTNAFSTSSFTPPSHASLFTSRQVGDHGLLAWNPLPEREITLAEVLAARGYRTGASVNLLMLSGQGLGQGFDVRREGMRDARAIVDDALAFLRDADERPSFLWLHLYDVHRPYGRAPGWAGRFARAAREGVGDGEDHYNLKPEHVRKRKLSDADLAFVAERYDAGIAYADAELGPLFAELASPARRARTLVIVTADHGENLLDHSERLFSHDPFLHSVVTRIPLFVRFPDSSATGSVRSELVSLIDLAPTVLDVLGLARPPTFAGRSLRAAPTDAPQAERVLFHEIFGKDRVAAARTSRWLAIRELKSGSTQLFALDEDKAELHALDPTSRADAKPLVAELERFIARRPIEGPPPALDPELERRLRALGYVDGDD